MRFDRFFKDHSWIPYAKAGCAVVLFYLLVSHIHFLFIGIGYFLGFISPVIIGLIIAYVLDPLVKLIETKVLGRFDKKPVVRRVASVWITILLLLVLVTVFFATLIPQLAESSEILLHNLGKYSARAEEGFHDIAERGESLGLDLEDTTTKVDELIFGVTDYLSKNSATILDKSFNVGRSIASGVISFILAIYMLCDKRRLQEGFRRFLRAILPDKKYHDVSTIWSRCNAILVRYIAGDLLEGLIVGVVNFIAMTAAGMEYKILISVIVGITNLAPTFGPIAGGAVGALILLLVNPWHAFWFIIFTLVIQTVDGYILKPKLFGNSLGVSSLWILICIIVLGRMIGVAGILVAIPISAILDIAYKEVILGRLEKRKAEKEEAARDEEAKLAAEQAAFNAAKEAIAAVARKDSSPDPDEERIKEQLASDADTIPHDI